MGPFESSRGASDLEQRGAGREPPFPHLENGPTDNLHCRESL